MPVIQLHGSAPVDKGWAWIIMLAAFAVHFFTFGYIRTSGIIFIEVQATFSSSSSMTSIINGAQSASFSLSTLLVVNVLMKHFTVRWLCIVGALLQSLGLALSSCAPNIAFLILTLGVIFGCSQALLYCPTMVLLNQYFNKKRPLATSIACCGVSAGGTAYSYMSRYFIDTYGFYGGLLLLSGAALQQCVFSALYRPLESYASADSRKIEIHLPEEQMELVRADISPVTSSGKRGHDNKRLEQANLNNISSNEKIDSEQENESSCVLVKQAESQKERETSHSQQKPLINHCNGSDPVGTDFSKMSQYETSNDENQICYETLHTQLTNKQEEDDHFQIEPPKSCEKESATTKFSLNCHIPQIIKTPIFWVVALFFMCGGITSVLYAVFIPPLMEEKLLSKSDISLGLVVSSIAEFAGRLLPGLILQCGFMSPTTIVLGPLLACATLFHLTDLFHDVILIICLAGAWGFLTGFFWSMQTLILIDVFGTARLGQVLGFYINFTGLGIGVSYPIAGALKDVFGSYSISYHYLGVMYWISAISLVVIHCCIVKKRKIEIN